MKIESICLNCNKIFLVNSSEIKRGNGKFCSRLCSIQFHTNEPTICSCGKKTTNKKYCSRSCAAKTNNSLYPKRHMKLQGCCSSCGAMTKKRYKFCNNCRPKQVKYFTYIEEWKSGLHQTTNKEYISLHIRKYLFEKYSNSCQICGWSETNSITGKVPLTVNHINGNWRDNREENLELLCPNCHSLTHNYGSLNKGNGRPKRRI